MGTHNTMKTNCHIHCVFALLLASQLTIAAEP